MCVEISIVYCIALYFISVPVVLFCFVLCTYFPFVIISIKLYNYRNLGYCYTCIYLLRVLLNICTLKKINNNNPLKFLTPPPPRKFLNSPPPKISQPPTKMSQPLPKIFHPPLKYLNPTRRNINPKNMLRGNPPPQHPFFSFSSSHFSFTFQKKSENVGGGGGCTPCPPLNTPLVYFLNLLPYILTSSGSGSGSGSGSLISRIL